MRLAVHLIILGRVQGVGYRMFALQSAQKHGIGGWVKNRPDGSVEAEGVGDPDALENWVSALRVGPPLARVESIRQTPRPARSSDPTAFVIQ